MTQLHNMDVQHRNDTRFVRPHNTSHPVHNIDEDTFTPARICVATPTIQRGRLHSARVVR